MRLSFRKILFLCECLFFLQIKFALAETRPQNYLCITEQSAGFKFKDGKWQGGEFSSRDTTKYYIKQSEKTNKHEITMFNSNAHNECSEYSAGFVCNIGDLKFEMNKVTLRYSSVYLGSALGPISKLQESEMKGEIIATPYVEIGACTEM